MTFPWWLVAILTCTSFVAFRSARFPLGEVEWNTFIRFCE